MFTKQRNVLLLIQPAYPERIQGIARFAKTHGWHLTIVDRLSRFPRGWRGDGALVTLRGNEDTNRFVRGLVRCGIPVVDLTFNHPEIRLPRVSGDHEAFGRLARTHYETIDFRHFAWYSTSWSHVHELRARGFRPDASFVLSDMVPSEKLDDWPLFLKVIGKCLRKAPKPLAVLAYDDADAAKVLSAAQAAGLRVPDEVSIMGIGNDTVICENQSVPLSSVGHDLALNGYEGAKLLEKLMSRHQPRGRKPETHLIQPRGIVARKSTDTLAADDPLLTDALREIDARLSTNFGVTDVANSLRISRAQLDRLFAEKFTRSIGNEIIRQRLERAKRLLAKTNIPIKDIAAECGFCNAGYLTNSLRKATGLTPKVWRRQHANGYFSM